VRDGPAGREPPAAQSDSVDSELWEFELPRIAETILFAAFSHRSPRARERQLSFAGMPINSQLWESGSQLWEFDSQLWEFEFGRALNTE